MILRRFLVPVAAALVCCIAPPLSADVPAVISIGPASGSFGAFTVPVNISSVTDLYAFQFDLSFDPAVLQLVGVSEGWFLPPGFPGSTIFFPGIIDNTAGTVTFVTDTRVGSVPGRNGSGLLADLHFQAVHNSGASPLDLSGVILQDSHLADIPFTISNGSVKAPEPRVLTWMMPLLALLWLGHKERARRSGP